MWASPSDIQSYHNWGVNPWSKLKLVSFVINQRSKRTELRTVTKQKIKELLLECASEAVLLSLPFLVLHVIQSWLSPSLVRGKRIFRDQNVQTCRFTLRPLRFTCKDDSWLAWAQSEGVSCFGAMNPLWDHWYLTRSTGALIPWVLLFVVLDRDQHVLVCMLCHGAVPGLTADS